MQNSQQMALAITVPDQSPIPTLSSPIQCRICLSQSQGPQYCQFIQPCKCSGSMQFVHFKCLCMWIERSYPHLLQQDEKRTFYSCEMCKYKIRFRCKSINECISAEGLKVKIESHKILFIFLVILMIVCFTLILVGIAILADSQRFDVTGLFPKILIAVGLAILLGLLILLIYTFITDYCLKTMSFITLIHNYEGNDTRKKRSLSPQKSEQTMVTQTKFVGSRSTIHPEFILRQTFD